MISKQNHKLISKIVLIILLGSFAVSGLVSAQGLSIAPDELINLDNLADQLKKLNKKSTEYQTLRTQAITACKLLGDKALNITKGQGSGGFHNISTIWTEDDNCTFGRWYTSTGGTDIMAQPPYSLRRDRVELEQELLIRGLWINTKNGKTFDSEVVSDHDDAVTSTSDDSGFFDLLSNAVGWVLTRIFDILASVLAALAAFAGMVLGYITGQTTTAAKPQIVDEAWVIVRDFMNLIFILALIVISLATILRVESYNYKKLLGRLILMAILINFSKVIAESLISVADMITSIFVGNNQSFGTQYGVFINGLVGEGKGILETLTSTNTAGQALAQGIFKVILLMVMTVSFLAVAGLLVIRLVGLWFLTMISPIAYALYILPATQQYAKQWWDTFIKYLIWAPVAVFFLRIGEALLIKKGTGSITINPTFDAVFIAAFMWAAVLVAMKAGMVGTDMVINGAKKVGFGVPMFFGKRGFGWAARRYNNLTSRLLEAGEGKKPPGFGRKLAFAALNPINFAKGWEKRAQHLKEEAQVVAVAAGQQVATEALTRGKLKMPLMQFAQKKFEDEKMKDYLGMTKEQMMRASVQIETLGGHEGEVERLSLLKAGASKGFLDDLRRNAHFAIKYADKDGTLDSTTAANRFLFGYLGGKKGHVNEQGIRFMADEMDRYAKDTHHPEYYGHGYFDPDTGEARRGFDVIGKKHVKRNGWEGDIEELKNTWQVRYMGSELNKWGGRDRAAMAPHSLWVIRALTARDDFGRDNDDLVDAEGNPYDYKDKFKQIKGEDTRLGRPDGSLDEAQKVAFRAWKGAGNEMQWMQSRQEYWGFEGEVDRLTGEFKAVDKGAVDKLVNAWNENSDPVRGSYCLAVGIKPRDNFDKIKGIRASYMDKQTGQRVYVDIGSHDVYKSPLGENIANDVAEDEELNVPEEAKPAVRKGVQTVAPKAYSGQVLDAAGLNGALDQLESSIREAGRNIAEVGQLDIGKIRDKMYQQLEKQIEDKFNPVPSVSQVEHKYNFSPSETSELSRALTKAVVKAFQANREGHTSFSTDGGRNNLRTQLQEVIRALKDKKDDRGETAYPGIGRINDNDINGFVTQIAPKYAGH
ncbi:MAG: type IV secretion system protein [Candidatus Doudnabacteria bacterium]|nr:type IV secretion system protein [Candidatus Doudnabacteria bacterium]